MVTYLGSLVQLCCWEGGALQRNITGVCGECSPSKDHTGFAPAYSSMCFPPVYTAQAPGRSLWVLYKVYPAFPALPRSKLLRFRFSGTPQRAQTRLGMRFVPSPGPSSSDDQGLGERTVPGGPCILITSLVLSAP